MFRVSRWNVLGYIHNRPLFSYDQLEVAFCQSSLFDNVTAAIIGLHRQRMKNGRLITLNIFILQSAFSDL
jgi:hypothetical protein